MKNISKILMAYLLVCILVFSNFSTIPVNAAGARINKTKVTILKGKSYQLKVSGASNVKWSSNKKKVATVNSKGKVTAKKVGTATITAKTSSKTLKCKVTVTQPVTKVTLNQTNLSLKTGDTYTLKATATPKKAKNKKVKWFTSNKNIVTVDNNGVVTAIGAGEATVTAKAKDGSGKKAVCVVNVASPSKPNPSPNPTPNPSPSPSQPVNPAPSTSSTTEKPATTEKPSTTEQPTTEKPTTETPTKPTVIPVESINLSQNTLFMTVGDNQTLEATVSPSNATDKTVTWTSSNENVVTVEDGKLRAVGSGFVTITVTASNEVTAACIICVSDKNDEVETVEVSSISLDKSSLTIEDIGDTFTLTATIEPSNATNKNVIWTSDKPDIVTVDNNGNLTAVGSGTATIKVTASNEKTAECKVKVKGPLVPIQDIEFPQSSYVVGVGGTLDLNEIVILIPANANEEIEWSASNTSAVSIKDGVLTGLKEGNFVLVMAYVNGVGVNGFSVHVTDSIPVNYVILNKSKLSMDIGETETLTATIEPANATNQELRWSSSNPEIATVDANGKVKAVNAGTTTIWVESVKDFQKTSCEVEVYPTVNTLSLNKTALTLEQCQKEALTLTIDNPNAKVIWTSSDRNICNVYPDDNNDRIGRIETRMPGTATITATAGSKYVSCTVTVTKVDLTAYKNVRNLGTYTIGGTNGFGNANSVSIFFRDTNETLCNSIEWRVIEGEKKSILGYSSLTNNSGVSQYDGPWAAVSVYALKAGKVVVGAYSENQLVGVATVNVTIDYGPFIDYENWKKEMKAKLWTNGMTDYEKIQAFKEYSNKERHYRSYGAGYYHPNEECELYKKYKGWDSPYDYACLLHPQNCLTSAIMLNDIANDLGLDTLYIGEFGETSDSPTNVGSAHVEAYIRLPEGWMRFDGTPFEGQLLMY